MGLTRAYLVDMPVGSLTGALSGNTVPNVPGVTATIAGQYSLPGESLGVGGEFVGRVAWQGKAFEVYGFAYNLFDQRYQSWGQSFGPATPTVRVGQGQILGRGSTIRF